MSPAQSSTFLSSGSNVIFLTSPSPAEVATNPATSLDLLVAQLVLERRHAVPPPFRTWRSTRSCVRAQLVEVRPDRARCASRLQRVAAAAVRVREDLGAA